MPLGPAEAVMVFVSSASQSGRATHNKNEPIVGVTAAQSENVLSAALTEDVCHTVFLDLFCSPSFNYNELGDNGYRSFQYLFIQMRHSAMPTSLKRIALDTESLCLSGKIPWLTRRRRTSLLHMYLGAIQLIRQVDWRTLWSIWRLMRLKRFSEDRINEYLTGLKNELSSGSSSAELSMQRCL